MASRIPNYFRTGIDPGEHGVREWIAQWAGDTSDISIRGFSINCPPPQQMPTTLSDPMLLAARRSRDSGLHCYLKYIAARWLNTEIGACTPSAQIRYEAQVYLPSADSLELAAKHGVGVPARSKKPRILGARDRNMNATHGCIIAADVLGGGTSVEVGFTQPFNLLSPLLEGLVRRAVWIPFPKGVDRAQFSVSASSLTSVLAYEFTVE